MSSLVEQFHAALDLAAAGDHARAATALAECVAADPQDPEFADAFLKSVEALAASRAGQGVEEPTGSIKGAWQTKQWDEIRRAGPGMLLEHPEHVGTYRALADAAAALGEYGIELRYLETATRLAPNGVELHRHHAKSLLRQGRFDDALAAWGRVQDGAPEDAEAATMVAQLAIEQSRQRMGVDSADGRKFGVVRTSKPEATESGLKPMVFQDDRMIRDILRQADQHKRTPVQQLEAAVRDHPSNPDVILKLASLYMEKSREYEAEKLLAKAKEDCDDSRVAETWEDVAMIRLDRKLASAEQHLEADDGEVAQAAVKEARKARDRFQTEVFLNRCKRDPTNPQLKYELGMRHKQAGKMRDAYECFVVALEDPARKALAACEMADCLETAGKIVEALQYYRMAAESAQPDQVECKKLALYRAGSLALNMRLHRLAKRYLDRLVRLDPDYAGSAELRDSLVPATL